MVNIPQSAISDGVRIITASDSLIKDNKQVIKLTELADGHIRESKALIDKLGKMVFDFKIEDSVFAKLPIIGSIYRTYESKRIYKKTVTIEELVQSVVTKLAEQKQILDQHKRVIDSMIAQCNKHIHVISYRDHIS